MGLHPAVKQSFFIKVLLTTSFIGNGYVFLQALAHTFNLHLFDHALRWYPFQANQWLNLFLIVGSVLTLMGVRGIWRNGMQGFRIYMVGKLSTTIAYGILLGLEYSITGVKFPVILLPVLVAIEAIYPVLLYISLRKTKARTSF